MYRQNPHIVSTENTLFIDENGNVIPNPYDTGYDEPEAVSYRRRIGVLEREEAELIEKIDALYSTPAFTDKQKALIAAYLQDARASSFFGRIKYRSIREVFIEPYQKKQVELAAVRRELARFRRLYEAAAARLTPEQRERYRQILKGETADNGDDRTE